MHPQRLLNATAVSAFAALALAAASASATVIDFDGLPNGTPVTNQFEGVTFSSEPGQQLIAGGGFICTGTPSFNCTQDVYIDFSTGVSGLSILAVEPNEFGTVATFFLYSGTTLLGTHDLVGLATTPGTFVSGTKLVSLAGFSGVTRLEIRGPGGSGDLDNAYGGNGIGWDNLTYTSGVVPEPGTGGLMLLGAMAVAAASRRAKGGRPQLG